MPWPWLLLPAPLGLALGHLWDRLARAPSGIPKKTPGGVKKSSGRTASGHTAPGRTVSPRRGPPSPAPSEKELQESRLARLLCPIFAQIARADGPINPQEVRHIRLYFEEELAFSEWGLSAVRAELKAWLGKEAEIQVLLAKARPEIPPAMRLPFVAALYGLAMTDGELQRAERELLQRVVRYLNLSEEQLRSVTSAFFGDGSEHYARLSLEPHASDEDIKKAYRQMAAAYHPDSQRGMSSQQVQKATETFHKIKEAYESLKKIRGF